jgi:cytochrome c oxidase assembly protein subunit 11
MNPTATPSLASQARNKRVALWAFGLVVFMVGLAYASVPFYRWFCQVTGFGGTTMIAQAAPAQVVDRVMRVRFTASVNQDMPWQFRALTPYQDVKIGEQATIYYEAYNPTSQTVSGVSTFNVTPDVGPYFMKLACFCFQEQTLKPGERVRMPVVYFIDPAIVEDKDIKQVRELSLNYTFFKVENPKNPEQGFKSRTADTPQSENLRLERLR